MFMSNPGKKHWDTVKSILRYLSGTADRQLCYGCEELSINRYVDNDYVELSIKGYVDSDYADCVDSHKSTTEAEYVALSKACKEAIWLARLVKDLGLEQCLPVLYCDSQSAIALAKNSVFHSKTKHIDVCYHFSCECLVNKSLDLVKIPMSENTSDALTNSLSSHQFQRCRELMGIG
ncbi:hypothetical protein L7F22_066809 [Adiantum nelumboides]|nr:hypothetical protein [Adiantum nelumboides]